MDVYRIVYQSPLGFKAFTDVAAVCKTHAFIKFTCSQWGCNVLQILGPKEYVSEVKEPIQAQLLLVL